VELGKTLRILFLPAALLAIAGCDGAPLAIVTLAEFQDENPDGTAQQDESILVYLDRALPEEYVAAAIQARIDPRPPPRSAPALNRTEGGFGCELSTVPRSSN
jgi:hypothetical protein